MKKLFICLFLVAGILLAHGCAEDPPPRLTGFHLQQVDTLYRAGIDSLRLAIELECAEQHDEKLAHLVDSLVQLRRTEEKEMRKRLLLDQNGDEQ